MTVGRDSETTPSCSSNQPAVCTKIIQSSVDIDDN